MTTVTAPAAPRVATDHDRRLDILAVAVPAGLALGLCLFELGSRNLWLDEAATVSIASQHGPAFAAALARDGGNMLGYYAVMHVLIGAFGHGAVVLRLPSAIAAAATVAITAAIGLRLWDRQIAAVSGLIAAVSLSLVYWGQDARSYAVMIALIAGSFLAATALVESERPSRGAWPAYVVLTTGAMYAALAAALVIPAHLVLLARRPARRRALVSGVAVVALCSIPLAVLAAERGSSQLFWVPAPSLRTAKQVLQALTSSGLQPGYYTASGDALLVITGLLALAGLAETVRALRVRAPDAWAAAVVAAWLVVPILAALAVSAAGHSIFQARYVLVSLPAMALLLAWTLRAAWIPRTAALALLAAIVVLRALALAPSYGVSTEQWRGATSYVVAHARGGDCMAFYPLDARMPFEYYGGAGHRLPRSVLPAVPWGTVRSYVEEYESLSPSRLAALPTTCSRVWLVWSHEGNLGGPSISVANFTRLRELRGALAVRYPGSSMRKFGRASPITIQLFRAAA